MKKNILDLLIVMLLIFMLAFCLSSCDDKKENQLIDNRELSSDKDIKDKEYPSNTENLLCNKFTITWENYDGTILEVDKNVGYNEMPSYDGKTPTKKEDAQYQYEFTGWSPDVAVANEDMVYTAQFSNIIKKFTVIWKNYDGTILETDEEVQYGETPSFDGNDPVQPNNAQYSYTFAGWLPSITKVTENVEYFARYTQTVNKYTVTWKNYDGTILEIDNNVEYGTVPSFDGVIPIKSCDNLYQYVFSQWDKKIIPIVENVEYIAIFNKKLISDFVFSNMGSKYAIKKYIGENEVVVIPEKYEDKPVVLIESGAFENCTHVKKICIKDSIVSLEKNCLGGCSNLEELITPFVGDGLANIYIGYLFDAYSYRNNYEKVPKSLSSIEVTNCNFLSANAFYGCSFIESITISSQTQTIEKGALCGCSSLNTLKLPFVGESKSSNKFFGYIFGTDYFSRSVEVIQDGKKYYVPTSLEKVQINGGDIVSGSFENCTNIKYLEINSGVSTLVSGAFAGCIGMEEIHIDSSLAIPAYIFTGCNNLKKIYVPIQNYSYQASDYYWTMYHVGRMFSSKTFDGSVLITQLKSGKNGMSGSGGRENYYLPASLELIELDCPNGYCGDFALYNIPCEINIINATRYGQYALSGSNIKTFDIPTCTLVPEGLFAGCENLRTINIPDGVETIEANAFKGCKALNNVSFPSSLKTIGKYAFRDCDGLADLDFSTASSELVIKSMAFDSCDGLINLIISNNVSVIEDSAFLSCSNLETVTFVEDSICRTLNGNTFQNCTSLIYVILSDSIVSTGESVFYGCSGLTIYSYKVSQPSGYVSNWNSNRPVVWRDSWEFNSQNIPVQI